MQKNEFLAKIHTLIWARSSVVERCPDKTEVEGPIPSAPTKKYIIYTILEYLRETKSLLFFARNGSYCDVGRRKTKWWDRGLKGGVGQE